MFLSEAIRKRQQLLQKAESMEKWYYDQVHGTNGKLVWSEMKRAIEKVIKDTYTELNKMHILLEKDEY